MKPIDLKIDKDAETYSGILLVDGIRIIDQSTAGIAFDEMHKFSESMAVKYPTGCDLDVTCNELCEKYDDAILRARIAFALGYVLFRNIIPFKLNVLLSLVDSLDDGVDKPGAFAHWVYMRSILEGEGKAYAEIKAITFLAGCILAQGEMNKLDDILSGQETKLSDIKDNQVKAEVIAKLLSGLENN